MWFILGLVSLAVFFGYRVYRKLYWAWGGSADLGSRNSQDKPYKTRHSSHKGTYWFRYAVYCPPDFHFRIKRETGWDRFAKRIGLSVEQQLDDPEFDEHFYLVSDDLALAGELSQVAALRQVIKALFRDPNLRCLRCEGQHLVAELKTTDSSIADKYGVGERGQQIVSALHAIGQALMFVTETHGARRRDSYILRAALLVSLASALLVLGGVEMFRLVYLERGDVIIDAVGLFGFSSFAAAAILFLFLGAVAALLRGSSHAHIVMWEVLISGGLGLLMSAYAIARDINCEWDGGIAKPLALEVTDKKLKHGRKSRTRYYLYLKSADGEARFPDRLEVKHSDYALAAIGEPLLIHVKEGHLGFRWVEAITRP